MSIFWLVTVHVVAAIVITVIISLIVDHYKKKYLSECPKREEKKSRY